MAEHPWFKLYGGDYLLDSRVDVIPREAEGLLLRMWCVCSREGSCPADPETLARKTLCPLPYVAQFLQHCTPFFELRDSKFFSRRMEREKAASERNRKNANKRHHKPKPPKSESESESKSERGNASRIATCIATHAPSPPTLDEVRRYCAERASVVDPERFHTCNQATGWMARNTPIVDWKALLRSWETNGVNHANGNGSSILKTLDRAFPKVAS
jgi:hypothetical protein